MSASSLVQLEDLGDTVRGISWNDDYIQVLSGGLLGDGSMGFSKRSSKPVYHETHGFRQREYALWKCRVLGASTHDETYFDERTGRFYSRSYLWVSDERNRGIYSVFYLEGKKKIRAEVLNRVEDLGLTVLWLDDGSTKLHDGNGKLSLQSFLPEENRVIMSWLARQYGVNSVLTSENEIFFNSKELPKLLAIMYPIFQAYHLPECMRYKMGQIDPLNANLVEEAREKRREKDRASYRKVMNDPKRRNELRERAKDAQRRRLSNPDYRSKYNEYQKEYMRDWRARHAK